MRFPSSQTNFSPHIPLSEGVSLLAEDVPHHVDVRQGQLLALLLEPGLLVEEVEVEAEPVPGDDGEALVPLQ